MFESSMKKYLQNWEALVKHLSAVEESEIQYQNYEQKLLSLESGRLLKARFSGFNEDFENTYALHKELTVIDPKLRKRLLQDVKGTFLPQYREFYHDFSKYQFSKKNQDDYLKYPPKRVESMMADMFSTY
jgi:exocyst complex protein 7